MKDDEEDRRSRRIRIERGKRWSRRGKREEVGGEG